MAKIEENTVAGVNQLSKSALTFFMGDARAGKKLLIIGNSITRHGPNESIGWAGDWGMAADSPEKDYVHVLQRKLEADGRSVFTMVRQGWVWERCCLQPDILNDFTAERDFGADDVVFRLGENVQLNAEKTDAALKTFVEYLCPRGKVLFTTCFWAHPAMDDCIRRVAAERGDPLVELGDIGADDRMTAKGKYAHSGVAAHPGNEGMEAIAEKVYATLKNLL